MRMVCGVKFTALPLPPYRLAAIGGATLFFLYILYMRAREKWYINLIAMLINVNRAQIKRAVFGLLGAEKKL